MVFRFEKSETISFKNSGKTTKNKMKTFIYILITLALGLIVFNITMLNFDSLFEGDSLIALIGIVASLCAICILLIFRMSKSIENHHK